MIPVAWVSSGGDSDDAEVKRPWETDFLLSSSHVEDGPVFLQP